ncbi:hypothetical protein ACIQWZ_37740 [Streptomyces sp. NPDC098077]|uniref:hypothetical protein n=1 Tax=Streptomyces sp. NPDC098077 TaxID=3366093 RepID=UPI0038263F98
MTDLATVFGLVGALGAAAIGMAGGSLLQRSKNRQDAETAAQQHQYAEQERTRLANQLALEIIACARTANRSLFAAMQRIQQDAEAGRPVDISRFDQEVGAVEKELTDALHRLAATGVVTPSGSADGQRPFAEEVAGFSHTMREHLLQITAGSSADCLATDLGSARSTCGDLNLFLRTATEKITGRPLGFRLAIDEV